MPFSAGARSPSTSTSTITDHDLTFERDQAAIAKEAALDGFYVLRTSVSAAVLDAAATVGAYKSLAKVERAFRSLKTVDLEIRPGVPLGGATGARPRLPLPAWPTTWNGTCARRLRAVAVRRPRPRSGRGRTRPSPVAKAKPSDAARRKANTKRTDDGVAVHSFRSLMADLATLTRNTVRFGRDHTTTLLATPTEIQRRAFQLLDVQPAL